MCRSIPRVIWARADRPARMLVEVATSDSFKTIERALFVDALPESDFTAKALIEGLPAGQDIFYRIRFQDLASPTIVGEPMVGRFRTAPRDRRSISFVWSGDTAGQGWGIDEARGGMRTYATMLRNRPDFFIHSGDTIYADGPILAEQKMPNGEIWKNVVTEEKSKPAETLAEFRGNYKYNLLDKNVRAFNAEVPIFAQWDDHEVTNNWWPGEPLTRAEHQRKKYVEKNALMLAARASRAFHEYMPMRDTQAEAGRVYRKISYGPLLDVFMLDMRSYRGPNGEGMEESYGPAAYFLGPDASRLAQARAAELAGDLEGDRGRHADRPDRGLRHRPQVGRRGDRPGRRARRADASSRLPTCSPSSSTPASATRCGSPPTCTTPPRIITIRTRRCSRISSRSGNSCPARSTPGPSAANQLDNTFGPQLMYVKAPSASRQPAAERRPAVLRPCRNRRRHARS